MAGGKGDGWEFAGEGEAFGGAGGGVEEGESGVGGGEPGFEFFYQWPREVEGVGRGGGGRDSQFA